MLPLPDGLEVDAHLVELESMGYTIVHGAIPPKLLARLQKCHAQAVKRIKECKPAADWSWESDNPGVVDYFRAYALVWDEQNRIPREQLECEIQTNMKEGKDHV